MDAIAARDVPSLAPLAFISHSSCDKERFVRRLVDGLQSKHVRTIFDERDFTMDRILPDAMFEEGIATADVIVIVLSHASLKSRFVKAEREAAVMRRIEEGVPNLLIVLDSLQFTEIPMSLRALIRISVDLGDEASIEEAIAKTADGAHRRRVEQNLGPPPEWVVSPLPAITGDPLDAAMLGIAARAALQVGAPRFVERDSYLAEAERLGRASDDGEDSILELARLGLLESYDWFGSGRTARRYAATRAGLSHWLYATDPGYNERLRIVGAALVNEKCRTNLEIERITGFDLAFVNHALDELQARGCVDVRRVAAAGMRRAAPTVALRRFLKQ